MFYIDRTYTISIADTGTGMTQEQIDNLTTGLASAQGSGMILFHDHPANK